MPTSVGPNTKGEENLVFGYDLGDTSNSYKGEPTTNYVPGTYAYNLYAYASGPVDTTVLNEKNQSITAKRYTITNAVNTARAAIYPSTTTGVSYTFSFKWKYNGSTTASPSVNVSAYKGNPETTNNSFTSETSSTVSIGNGWYLTTYTFNFSSNPTSGCILTFGISTGSTAGFVGETFDVYEAQFEIKDHKTQYSNGTRSATQGLIDLKGNSTIDLTNVSFDSNAQMTFDGTNDNISIGSFNLLAMGSSTLEAVVYMNNLSSPDNSYSIFGGYSAESYHGYHEIRNSGSGYKLTYWTSADGWRYANTALSANTWYYITWVWEDLKLTWYVNGVADGSYTFSTFSPYGLGFSKIGYFPNERYMNGKIPLAKVYNRALTASEVRSNFNAIKGRFNI